MPSMFVMAGPNGAGKTTTSGQILTGERSVAEFVNADLIAAMHGLSEIAAARLMLGRLDELTRQRADVAFETTLSSASLRGRIAAMRAAGYVFHLIYLWIPSADMSVKRVAARVEAGGHSIPEAVIRRRYARSLVNFFNVYMPLADAWTMLDNSRREKPAKIAERDIGGPLRVHDELLWGRLVRRYMKPVDKAEQQRAMRPAFTMHDIYEAACLAVAEALARHKALGQHIVVWENGKVVTLEPEQIDG